MARLRRTMLYVPGNNPGMIADSPIYGSDSIMLDLEDSVSLPEKDAARLLVFQALETIDFGDKEVVVRVNALDTADGMEDLNAMVRTGKVVVRLPKTETADEVVECDRQIARIEKEHGLEAGSTRMMAAIESAEGVLNAKAIATATKRLTGIAIGAEDYVTDLRTTRSADGIELLFARSMVLLAARAAGIDAIDTVYSDVDNEAGLRKEVALIKQLGFDGKSIISPRQIGPVNEIFTPSSEQIRHALAVKHAIEQAQQRGSGVIALDGAMVDKPVATRAFHIRDLAAAAGVLTEQEQDK